jgi:hypothetical protein
MIYLMGQRQKHADSVRVGDELFVCKLLDQMEGRPNFNKAQTIVRELRKRMKERHLEIERRAAERIADNTAKGGTISP